MASTAATYLGFLLLTINSILAIYRSRGDAAAVLFVLASYLTLVHLFYSLRRFEESAPGSAARDRARVGVWLPTTVLTALVSWRVSSVVMSWPVAGGVCCFMGNSNMAVGVGSYPLFSWWLDAATTFLLVAYYLSFSTLLLYCLCRWCFEAAPTAHDPAARDRDDDRASISRLETKLTTPVFSWEVAALIPTPIASAVVLLVSTATVSAGFYALFLLSMRV